MTTTERQDPYDEGRAAYLTGKPESDNPYDIRDNEQAYLAWLYGWNEAMDGDLGV